MGSFTVAGYGELPAGLRPRLDGEQDPAAQIDALSAAGVDQLFVDHASGVLSERPELTKLLAQIRPGDTLVVWRLDRLGRSTPDFADRRVRPGGSRE